ncbi:MAG: glycerol-3-phosphate 1-O-acyltransferase PlsY [Roseofilum sp. SBFL]|uniref:glycerol-3-phosphate 1-O-acyltransferase PlsY n=1 Tax=unclassified Roseofilum TaxID=2620099 RepID=UPI001B08FFB8|nr:glycerol-3-phosphate 1-O-acyltransferase PlsY [Roseofilum sp. SID3]MBP0024701.1 glycerol-3-phosphate 1-O-acyltransferase PlsY [Roseofilum sp. SID2]MBP0039508.1 glycerol-3-phosphate 1-O-acyltransferase PlsY [Roseofilum sp. SID1]MBP0042534.1 glycerol-3-phosphate 1-O-acyltransferase PlsY [Roseofilum sp. SBFL]
MQGAIAVGVLIGAYLLGSIPTGYWLTKALKGIDIRESGSGSTGATNVLRTVGKGAALTVLLVDVLKGVAAIFLVRFAYQWQILTLDEQGQSWIVVLAGFLALFGHSLSIWLIWNQPEGKSLSKGGKSAATSLGVLLALYWPVGLLTFAVFGSVIGITRIVSLGSMSAAIAVSALMAAFHQPLAYEIFGIMGGLYVIWRHRSNIERLLAGTEPKIGQTSPQVSELPN